MLIELLLLSVLWVLLIWHFLGYPLIMATRYNSSCPINKDYNFKQSVSMIVATYNESTTIRTRLNNLINLNYPKKMYEIIVVDSGSTDIQGTLYMTLSET